jgi:hypothetical protein
MAEPTNGTTKTNVKSIMAVILGVGIVLTAGWIVWVSNTHIDHEKRISLVEQSHKIMTETILELKKDSGEMRIEVSQARAILVEVRADQIRRQKKER